MSRATNIVALVLAVLFVITLVKCARCCAGHNQIRRSNAPKPLRNFLISPIRGPHHQDPVARNPGEVEQQTQSKIALAGQKDLDDSGTKFTTLPYNGTLSIISDLPPMDSAITRRPRTIYVPRRQYAPSIFTPLQDLPQGFHNPHDDPNRLHLPPNPWHSLQPFQVGPRPVVDRNLDRPEVIEPAVASIATIAATFYAIGPALEEDEYEALQGISDMGGPAPAYGDLEVVR